jgi:hypothetical protein
MDIKLVKFEKNQVADIVLDGTNMAIALQDYELTQSAQSYLSKIYEDWQVNHIAKVLNEMMLNSVIAENKSRKVEDKTIEETFFPLEASEADPYGIDQHELGAKLDSGKIKAGLLVDFSNALLAVAEVGTFGANKYTRGGWQHVLNGPERYTDAMLRHLLKEPNEPNDPDSDLKHASHLAWNALARLELMLRAPLPEKDPIEFHEEFLKATA